MDFMLPYFGIQNFEFELSVDRKKRPTTASVFYLYRPLQSLVEPKREATVPEPSHTSPSVWVKFRVRLGLEVS